MARTTRQGTMDLIEALRRENPAVADRVMRDYNITPEQVTGEVSGAVAGSMRPPAEMIRSRVGSLANQMNPILPEQTSGPAPRGEFGHFLEDARQQQQQMQQQRMGQMMGASQQHKQTAMAGTEMTARPETVPGHPPVMGNEVDSNFSPSGNFWPVYGMPYRRIDTQVGASPSSEYPGITALDDMVSIPAVKDEDIHSIADGEVIASGKTMFLGGYIAVRHNNGISIYAHVDNLKVKEGERVGLGQPIATPEPDSPSFKFGVRGLDMISVLDPMAFLEGIEQVVMYRNTGSGGAFATVVERGGAF